MTLTPKGVKIKDNHLNLLVLICTISFLEQRDKSEAEEKKKRSVKIICYCQIAYDCAGRDFHQQNNAQKAKIAETLSLSSKKNIFLSWKIDFLKTKVSA